MVSPRKSLSALSNTALTHHNNNMNARSAKSCESLYSNNSKYSANLIYRRKAPSAAADKNAGLRQPALIPATNEVRQRVLSARRLRIKNFQNQLANAQQTIAELAHENRILRTLHKRQDSALAKYESTNAELPQLLHSHAEELRVWQTKYRNLQGVNKDLEQKLKQKELIILSLSDQNKYYIQLNKDKNLDDRQKLSEKLQNLETRLLEKENDIKMMARKMQLEAKQSKHQLQVEQKKTKEVLLKLEKARLELSGFRKLEEIQLQEKFNLSNFKRPNKSTLADDKKEIRDLDKISEANTEEYEALHSHRSTHSSNTVTQRSHRSPRKTNPSSTTKDLFSPRVGGNTATRLPTANKTMVNSRRIDKGDGDAGTKMPILQPNLTSNVLPELEERKSENPSTEYEDEFENDGDADAEEGGDTSQDDDLYPGTGSDTQDLSEDGSAKHSQDSTGETGHYIDNIDSSSNLDKEMYEENVDYFKETTTKIETNQGGKKFRMKEEISSIRKQISDDYKEREAFLDTFCRQATTITPKDDTPKKRNITADHTVPGNRKHKLLAALKAIDDNKSQD